LSDVTNTWGRRPIPPEVAERAITRYVPNPNGCHISTYSVASHGYAQIGWTVDEVREDGRRIIVGTTAHRAAWVAATGEQIPPGLVVDHTCHNRQCVNPEHLRLLTNEENADTSSVPKRPVEVTDRECATCGSRIVRGSAGEYYCRNCTNRRLRERRRSRTVA